MCSLQIGLRWCLNKNKETGFYLWHWQLGQSESAEMK